MKKLTTEEFVKMAKILHGNKYNYDKVDYKNTDKKIIIVCPTHGLFIQSPKCHLRGNGCLKCSMNALSIKKTMTKDQFVDKAKKVHNNKYSYEKSNYINSHYKVIIICPIHGEFLQNPNNHLNRHGCFMCKGMTNSLKQRSNTHQFIEKARKIHGNKYNYDNVVYVNNRTRVKIYCPEDGEFLQRPIDHLCGKGCLRCKKKSKGELLITKILNKNNIHYIRQKTFDDCINPKTNCKLFYDFCFPQKKILLEYNGKQHYEHVKHWNRGKKSFEAQQYRDALKKEYAINNGYKFIVIKYNDNVEQILKESLLI